jgi:hypothetical protein
MESRENRHFLIEFAQELLDSEELRPELELLIDEFSIRLGTLAERWPA